MLKRTIKGALHTLGLDVVRWVPPLPPPAQRLHPKVLTHRQLIDLIRDLSYWQDKIKVYEHFTAASAQGSWLDLRDGAPRRAAEPALLAHEGKIHYGCGNTYLPGWLNIDLTSMEQIEKERQQAKAAQPDIEFPNYAFVNLLERHPFSDNSVRFGFSEDMIEHLTQGQSIFALSEMYRTLTPGGILRLTFPCLEGVLAKHYTPPTSERVMQGEFEAYEFWDHIHFYSKEELRLVAEHLGFRDMRFVDFHQSEFAELRGLETRSEQVGLNLYVEMTK
jgi:predicted SAM-dependent methyltransferase